MNSPRDSTTEKAVPAVWLKQVASRIKSDDWQTPQTNGPHSLPFIAGSWGTAQLSSGGLFTHATSIRAFFGNQQKGRPTCAAGPILTWHFLFAEVCPGGGAEDLQTLSFGIPACRVVDFLHSLPRAELVQNYGLHQRERAELGPATRFSTTFFSLAGASDLRERREVSPKEGTLFFLQKIATLGISVNTGFLWVPWLSEPSVSSATSEKLRAKTLRPARCDIMPQQSAHRPPRHLCPWTLFLSAGWRAIILTDRHSAKPPHWDQPDYILKLGVSRFTIAPGPLGAFWLGGHRGGDKARTAFWGKNFAHNCESLGIIH